MIISFILPGAGNSPCGGYKVVYEYANGLAQQGHQVRVIHSPQRMLGLSLREKLRCWAIYGARKAGIDNGYRPDKWFNLDPKVEILWRPSLDSSYIPPADVVFATAWESAEYVAGYPENRGKKYYLIQHFEAQPPYTYLDRVIATWKAPLRKIVISRWLQDKATELGQTAEYIPNGMDFKKFGLDTPIEQRNPATVMMLYHRDNWKGSEQGIAALMIAKERCPELKATLFGVFPKPENLPQWIVYHQNPPQATLRELYNNASIFIAPSWAEGWPLPPAEAMISGCALAVTDIGGHREYAMDNKTALLSPIKDPQTLANNIVRLILDQPLRTRIATEGNLFIQQFTWARAVYSMITLLKRDISY